MKKIMVQVILFCGGALLIIALLAILIEIYFFSWTGFLWSKVDLCEYKSLNTLAENSKPQKTSFDFDTEQIAYEMSRKTGYQVSRFSNDTTLIIKKFGEVNYEITFYSSQSLEPGFKLRTSVDDPQYPRSVGGEKCNTPNRVPRNNIFAIIDDLPLNISQKDEMKSYVKVTYTSTLRLW